MKFSKSRGLPYLVTEHSLPLCNVAQFFKLRLGALIPRSVGRSVGPPKITKKIQNFIKLYKMLQNIKKR